MGPKEHLRTRGYTIYRVGLLKQDSSDDIHSVITTACTIAQRFDPTQITSRNQQRLLSIRAKRHSLACMCKVHHVQGGKGSIIKAANLSNGKSPVQRGQP